MHALLSLGNIILGDNLFVIYNSHAILVFMYMYRGNQRHMREGLRLLCPFLGCPMKEVDLFGVYNTLRVLVPSTSGIPCAGWHARVI